MLPLSKSPASAPNTGCIVPEKSPGGSIARRSFILTLAGIGFITVCGLGEVFRRYGLRETRPACEDGEDPLVRDCLPQMPKVNWEDPSFAEVQPNETLVELRWFKGKLLHPVGRFFGGHHSALVGVFSSGRQVRIEKYGARSVQYCPLKGGKKCSL